MTPTGADGTQGPAWSPHTLEGAGTGPLEIGGAKVGEGARTDLQLQVSESYTGDRTSLPVTVVNGVRPGPLLFVTAAVHGDELNGIAIVREVLARVEPADLSGALMCVPVVNVLGVQFHSRYLPDRRDLNRCFPGSASGSTAGRIAHALMTEIIGRCDAGIDLHTAANRRMNVPQIRCSLHDERAFALGMAFGAPFIIEAARRPGSLRDAAAAEGVPVLTFEGGEALRFEQDVIAVGTAGVLRVMGALGMLDDAPPPPAVAVVTSDETHWIRADRGGILHLHVGAGEHVAQDQPLWTVTGPFGRERSQTHSPYSGVVIGMTTLPLVNPGDAVVHLALPGEHAASSINEPLIDEPSDEEDADRADEDEDEDRT
ncbi:succinylglutamate desuccinylase/aspartoacylase family protein [soil metagenome]